MKFAITASRYKFYNMLFGAPELQNSSSKQQHKVFQVAFQNLPNQRDGERLTLAAFSDGGQQIKSIPFHTHH